MGQFVTVSRGTSAAVLLPDQGFEARFSSPRPVLIRMRTRWRNAGIGHPLPDQLWLEASGEGDSFDETTREHDALTRSAAMFFSFVANAAVGTLETELAFDATPGIDRRAYRQTFIRDEPLRPGGGRVILTDQLASCFQAWISSSPEKRLGRAVFHYGLALRSWRIGTEFQCLDHLWIAAENIAVLHLRRRLGERTRLELADELGIDTAAPRWGNELDAWSRRELVFDGDTATYDAAKVATDGYEHGFMDLDEVQQTAVSATDSAFAHVRRAIADLLDFDPDDRAWLLGLSPVDVASTRKSIRGALVGNVVEPGALAHPSQEYPIVQWSSRVRSFTRDGDSFAAVFTESFTPLLAAGVEFEAHRIEARGRPSPGQEPQREEAQFDSTLNIETMDLGDVGSFLDRSLRALAREQSGELTLPANRSPFLGMLSHGFALAEAVASLVKDRRAVEGLAIAAQLFEFSVVVGWLAAHADEREDWLKAWARFSSEDASDLRHWETWSGRRPLVSDSSDPTPDSPTRELPPWPPTSDWLQDEAAGSGRQRSWWFWRLSRSLKYSAASIGSRVVGSPTDMLVFATRETDLDDLAQVAAFAVESLSVLHRAACFLLDMEIPDANEPVNAEATAILGAFPRANS